METVQTRTAPIEKVKTITVKETTTEIVGLQKAVSRAFKKDVYLLWQDAEGINYRLEAPSRDCGRYWGFGYVETYQRNSYPNRARDIDSHSHWDSSVVGKGNSKNDKDGWNWYCHNPFDSKMFTLTAFNKEEGRKLGELFSLFYKFQEVAGIYHRGGAHVSSNWIEDEIKNIAEYKRITGEIMPKIFVEILKILSPEWHTPTIQTPIYS